MLHVKPFGQIWPQPPQLRGSLSPTHWLEQHVPTPPPTLQATPSAEGVHTVGRHAGKPEVGKLAQAVLAGQSRSAQAASSPLVAHPGTVAKGAHWLPLGQAAPQPPQSKSSASVQDPPQHSPTTPCERQAVPFAAVAQVTGGVATQKAPLQLCPTGQAAPQAPQLSGSTSGFTQTSAQHSPAARLPPDSNAHPPPSARAAQLSAKQAPAMQVLPAGHGVSVPHGSAHVALMQPPASLAEQVRPQPPQFSASDPGSTHCSPQQAPIARPPSKAQPWLTAVVDWQLVTQQLPPIQTEPVPQAAPQAPQFAESVSRLVQLVPQQVS